MEELILYSGDGRDGTYDERNDGLVALQERLEDEAAARNKNKFTVPDEIREVAAVAAKCRDPVRRKSLRKGGSYCTQGIRRRQSRPAWRAR